MTDDKSPLHDGAEEPGEGTQVAKVKKPWYRKWWVWVIVVVVIAAALSPSDDDGDETAQGEVTSAPSATEEPTPEPEETSEPEDLVTIPDVSGMSADEARDQLKELDFKVELDGGDKGVWAASNWEVESADPALGSEVKKGTEVTLNVTQIESSSAEPKPAATDPVGEYTAQSVCEEYAIGQLYPDKVKFHRLTEKYANERRDDGRWFYKVGITVKSDAGAKLHLNMECFVTGTEGSPSVDEFLVY